ncbi:hypothetical protein ACHQM5_011889 [Ranunculus cassubicifolius]
MTHNDMFDPEELEDIRSMIAAMKVHVGRMIASCDRIINYQSPTVPMVPAVRDNVSSSMATVSPNLTHEGFVSTTAIQNIDNYSDANPPVPDPATANRSKSNHRDSDRSNPEGFPDRPRTRSGETVPGLLMTPDGSGARPEFRSTPMNYAASGFTIQWVEFPVFDGDYELDQEEGSFLVDSSKSSTLLPNQIQLDEVLMNSKHYTLINGVSSVAGISKSAISNQPEFLQNRNYSNETLYKPLEKIVVADKNPSSGLRALRWIKHERWPPPQNKYGLVWKEMVAYAGYSLHRLVHWRVTKVWRTSTYSPIPLLLPKPHDEAVSAYTHLEPGSHSKYAGLPANSAGLTATGGIGGRTTFSLTIALWVTVREQRIYIALHPTVQDTPQHTKAKLNALIAAEHTWLFDPGIMPSYMNMGKDRVVALFSAIGIVLNIQLQGVYGFLFLLGYQWHTEGPIIWSPTTIPGIAKTQVCRKLCATGNVINWVTLWTAAARVSLAYSFHGEPRKWELQCLIDKIGGHSNNVGMKSGNELPYSSELQSTGNTNSMGKHQSTTVSSVRFYAVGKLVHALFGRYLYGVIKTLFVVIGPPYGSPIMIQLLVGDIRQQQFYSKQINGCGYGLTGSCHLSVYGARYAKFRIGMVHSLAKVLRDVIMSKAKVIDISATCGQLAPNQTSSQPAFDQLAIHFNYVVMLPCGQRWALYELYMHIHRVRSGMCFDPGGHSPFFGVTFAFLAFTMRYGLKYFTAFDAQVLSTDSSGTIHGKFLTANLHKVERNDFLISAVHLNTYVVTYAAAILDVFLETRCLMFLSWPLLMVGAMWLQTSHVLHPKQHRQLRNCNDSLNVCCYSAAVLFENAYLGSIVIGKVLECFGVASTLSWLWVHCSNGGRTQSRMLYSSQCGLTVYNARCMKAQCGVSHIPWHIFDLWPHYVKGTGYLQSTTPFFWQVSVQGVNYRPLTFKLLSDSINLCPRNTVLTVREYKSVQEMSQGSPKFPPIAVPMRINCQFQVLRGVVLVMSAHVYGHCSWLSNIGDSVDQSMRVQSSNTAIPVRESAHTMASCFPEF